MADNPTTIAAKILDHHANHWNEKHYRLGGLSPEDVLMVKLAYNRLAHQVSLMVRREIRKASK